MAEGNDLAILVIEFSDDCRERGGVAFSVDEKLIFESFAADRTRFELGEIDIVGSEYSQCVIECAGCV